MKLYLALFLLLPAVNICAQPSAAALATFNTYSQTLETRLQQQHRSTNTGLASLPQGTDSRLRNGELSLQQLSSAEFSGAMLHHWRGTAFVPNAKAADFCRILRDLNNYPRYFSPQIVKAWTVSSNGNFQQTYMRVRQKHVLTVVLDINYDTLFTQFDATRGSSISHSTHVSEIDSPDTKSEHALKLSDEHGFLWEQNTYWSYEERGGGLYIQIESVVLTRNVPHGLGWAIGPYIQSIPRDSLEFTLRSMRDALQQEHVH